MALSWKSENVKHASAVEAADCSFLPPSVALKVMTTQLVVRVKAFFFFPRQWPRCHQFREERPLVLMQVGVRCRESAAAAAAFISAVQVISTATPVQSTLYFPSDAVPNMFNTLFYLIFFVCNHLVPNCSRTQGALKHPKGRRR